MFKNSTTKKLLNENSKAKSKELNPPTLIDAPIIDDSRFEDIIKTTDSMNVMITRNNINEKSDALLLKTREAIAQSYELARRRINATYQDIVDSSSYVGVQFLAVQIALLNYEKEWDVKRIEYALNIFVNAIIESLSRGVGIAMTNYIVFETVVYVDKILPVASTTPNFAMLINTIVWDELFEELANANKLTITDRPIIESLVLVLEENVKRGYYVQLNDFIITKISPTMTTLVILFSYDFLIKINKEYKRYMSTRKKPTVVVGNELSSMNASLKKIDNIKFKEQMKEEDALEDDNFVPHDDIDDMPREEYLQNFTFELSLAERASRPKINEDFDENELNVDDDLDLSDDTLNKKLGLDDDINNLGVSDAKTIVNPVDPNALPQTPINLGQDQITIEVPGVTDKPTLSLEELDKVTEEVKKPAEPKASKEAKAEENKAEEPKADAAPKEAKPAATSKKDAKAEAKAAKAAAKEAEKAAK